MELVAFAALGIVAYSFLHQMRLWYRLTNPAGVNLHRNGTIGPEPWVLLRQRLVVSPTELETHEVPLAAGSQQENLGKRQFLFGEP